MVPPINIGTYILKDDIERFGTSDKDAVIGKVHCIGTESGLLECSHSSIGSHYCSPYYFEPDIVISCYGMYGCAGLIRYSKRGVPLYSKLISILPMHKQF